MEDEQEEGGDKSEGGEGGDGTGEDDDGEGKDDRDGGHGSPADHQNRGKNTEGRGPVGRRDGGSGFRLDDLKARGDADGGIDRKERAKKVGVWLEGVQPCSPPQCPRTPPGENIAYPFPPLSPTHCYIAAEMQAPDEIISSRMDVYRQGVRLSVPRFGWLRGWRWTSSSPRWLVGWLVCSYRISQHRGL